MKVIPVSFYGKYYDFVKNDPRKEHSRFMLGMPNDAVVELENVGGFPYPITAGKIREEHIRALYPDYHYNVPDSKVVGQDTTSYGLKYDVTAGNVRDEISREELAQKRLESEDLGRSLLVDNYHG